MPEITDAQLTEYHQYRAIAPTPSEITRKIEEAIKDNGKQRDEIRELKEKVKAVPAEGAVVLAGDDATAYAAWKALELKPEDVAKIKGERDEFAGKIAQRDRKDGFAKVATLHGWAAETADAMLDMKSLDGATLEFKATKVRDKSGKEVDGEEAWVTLAGEGQKPQKFGDFAAASPQLKGLKMEAVAPEPGRYTPEQVGDPGREKVGQGIDAMIADNLAKAKAGNPLTPKAATA